MQRKFIVTDLDGTALSSHSDLGFLTKYYILKAQHEGHYVSIATGRSFSASYQFYKELHLSSYLVNLNGCLITNPSQKDAQKQFSKLNHDPIIALLQSPLNDQIRCSVFELERETVIDRIDSQLINLWTLESRGQFKPNVYPRNQIFSHDIAMASIFVDEGNEQDILNFLSPAFSQSFHARVWHHEVAKLNVIEIYNKSISKVEGIEFVAKKLEIPKSEIITFGDQVNDLEMIEYASNGVAMKNAIAELKAVADEITDYDNVNSGVGYHLQKLLKL